MNGPTDSGNANQVFGLHPETIMAATRFLELAKELYGVEAARHLWSLEPKLAALELEFLEQSK